MEFRETPARGVGRGCPDTSKPVPATTILHPRPLETKGNPSELVGDNEEADCLIKIKLSNKLAIL